MFDLEPATTEMSRLVRGVDTAALDYPTPCDDWAVRDLLAHVHQFVDVFTTNARKGPLDPPDGLVANWRTVIPAALDDLARAWSQPSAWEGRTSAGGIEMDAADNAIVAVEELTIHAWDLARATGQGFAPSDDVLAHVEQFFVRFSSDTGDDGPFGPRGPLPADADRLDRVVATAGRDPRWTV
ncbi:MAG: TIGR03086 family protein [Williamsia herbipolensis]|nr:TIGR03086 family protein [Williamsia herbipolensis]